MSYITKLSNIYFVSPEYGDFSSIKEAVDWLSLPGNMSTPITLYMSAGTHEISDTIIIDLPYGVNIKGSGYDICTLAASVGLANKPMFDIKTACDIYSLYLDGTTLEDYGNNTGENAINVSGDNIYCEFVDFGIEGFNIGVSITSNAELWIFNSAINSCIAKGVVINTTSIGTRYRSAETDYSNSPIGIDLMKATDLYFSSEVDTSELVNSGDIFIKYDGTNITYMNLIVKGAVWNEVGNFWSGFDFTRTDGRDANVEIMYNVGKEDTKPACKINVIGNTSTTSLDQNVWTKAVFTNTNSIVRKWKAENNKITFLSTHQRDVVMNINMSVESIVSNKLNLHMGIVKKDIVGTIYGHHVVSLTSQNRYYNAGFTAFLTNVTKDDYFEIYVMNDDNNYDFKVTDITWFTEVL